MRSRRAVGRLFRAYNDIDVYVEDKTYIGIYEKIINISLKGRARVTRVIPLGPKSDVIKAAANDLSPEGRPRLYIVDGDLDLLAFARQPSYTHLHRLNVYSVENLLISPQAIGRYCSFASPSMEEGICAQKVNPTSLISELEWLLPYVIVLGVARRLGINDAALAFNPPSVTKTLNGRHVGPDRDKVRRRLKQLISFITGRVGWKKYGEAKRCVVANVKRRKILDHRLVPGKYFGLMYLNERVSAAGGVSLPQKIVVSYLSDHCGLSNDKRLAARLRQVAKP